MKLMVHVDSDAGPDLYRWLVADTEVDGLAPHDDSRPGDMGLAFDVLNLVIPNAIALASLVTSILTFRESRKQSGIPEPAIRIECGDVVVRVEGDPNTLLARFAHLPPSQEQLGPTSPR